MSLVLVSYDEVLIFMTVRPNVYRINILIYLIFFIFRRQEAVIERIFDPKAMQCKNCGVRYSPNDQRAYEQHLNWHFRMNKKNKENARKAQSRKW